jgi:hypothetical protein
MRNALVRPLALAGLSCALVASVLAGPSAARGRDLDPSGAVVTPPDTVTTRTLSPVAGCRTLLVTGEGDCAVVDTAHGELLVTVEPGERIDDVLASRPWTVTVSRPSATVPDGWDVALVTHPTDGETGPLYAAVTARAADVTGDGADELLLGYRHEGTGMILDLDIVGTEADGTPTVLAHDELYKGSVVLRDGRLTAYTPVYRTRDANCCPTWIAREVLRDRNGELRFDRVERVKTDQVDVPSSDLG